jgi:hypothetical protein
MDFFHGTSGHHSCTPSCKIQRWRSQGDWRVVIVATRQVSFAFSLVVNFLFCISVVLKLLERKSCNSLVLFLFLFVGRTAAGL